MTASELREKFIKFFKAEPRKHEQIEVAPLVSPDPTTLFTSAGMQPLVPYLMGKPHPRGKRLVNSQPSLRLEDIEEVGDTQHTTFFEMLGNWSLGDYFKEEQLAWFYEFLTKELGLPKDKLYITCFEGTKDVARDEESAGTWKKLGIPEERIFYYGVRENWWSRTGAPENMQTGDIGGPDSEVFYDFGIEHDPAFGKECHPNCQCGRFLEIGNSVFIEYQKMEDGSLKELPQKNVDFGGGLERLVAATEGEPDVFRIDLISGGVDVLENLRKKGETYDENPKPYRVILDHLRASIFIAAEGVEPSNKGHGYALRRLVRRSMLYARELGMVQDEWLSNILPVLASPYSSAYRHVHEKIPHISEVLAQEVDKFRKTIDRGLKEFSKYDKGKLSAREAFFLYETYGFPYELIREESEKRGIEIPSRQQFAKELEKHRELSRTASAGMFRGGLADTSEDTVKLHTATHLLHAALRKVLGEHVEQKGSNITSERLRFDFSHPKKLSEREIKRISELVNEKIQEDLPVTYKEMTMDKARGEGALAFFGEKYGERVKVYTIGPSTGSGQAFSKEVCGGPHVKSTGELGHVKINKEESAGSGVRRVYATISDSDSE